MPSDKPEWFKTWFDTPYYHILYQDRNEKEADDFLDALLAYLKLPKGSLLLDVACGTGRYSRFLSDHGYDVTGIDLSLKNIQLAGEYENDHLTFYIHDMREIFYVNYFDAAFNFFTSFGYFSTDRDNLRAVRALSHSLKRGGRLVIDFFNSRKVISEIIPKQQIVRNGIFFNIQKHLERNVIVKKISFYHEGRNFNFEERVQALTLADFEKYFSGYDLKVKDVFGDYKLQPFDENASERMIVVAEKV